MSSKTKREGRLNARTASLDTVEEPSTQVFDTMFIFTFFNLLCCVYSMWIFSCMFGANHFFTAFHYLPKIDKPPYIEKNVDLWNQNDLAESDWT